MARSSPAAHPAAPLLALNRIAPRDPGASLTPPGMVTPLPAVSVPDLPKSKTFVSDV